MYHSVYFGDKNTWDDYSLVPVNKIYIPSPSQKTNFIEVEGASGSLDFSTLITGYPIYSNIPGDMKFYLLNRHEVKNLTNSGYAYPQNYTFYDIFGKIKADLHGKQFNVWLEDDPDWYYKGRISVTTEMTTPRPTVTIGYNFDPYKRSRKVQSYNLIGMGSVINRQKIGYDILSEMPTNFTFKVTGGGATVRFTCEELNIDDTKTLTEGTYTFYEWVAYKEATVMLSAATTVTLGISFECGRV